MMLYTPSMLLSGNFRRPGSARHGDSMRFSRTHQPGHASPAHCPTNARSAEDAQHTRGLCRAAQDE
eukprot:4853756-Lingulodinium_polyedra.AAC.1